MGAHQRARAPASLRPDTSRTRCTHCISPARRVRQTDEADRATASCSQYALHPMWGTAPVAGRCTLYVALHPMWGATPDQKRCNAYGSGAAPLSTSTFAATRSHQSSADEHTTTSHKRCTLYVALHPIRRGAMPTDRVQRPTQQAFSRRRTAHLIPHRHTCRPHLEHLPLWV